MTGSGPSAAGPPPALPPTGVVPPPPTDRSTLEPEIETWDIGTTLFRGHDSGPHGRRFNPKYGGRKRFSFFPDEKGHNVPVLYAGRTIEVAIAETLFHDLPTVKGATLLADKEPKYTEYSYSKMFTTRELRLAALHSWGLRSLELKNHQIIDTDAREYPDTVKWAEALHSRADLALDGLTWMSRQFNREQSVVLFGDRVKEDDLELDPVEKDISFGHGDGLRRLLLAADRAKIRVQPPKGGFVLP